MVLTSVLQAVFRSVPVTPVIRQTRIVIAVHFSCGLCWAQYLVFLEFMICWWSLVFLNQCLGRMCSISKSIENNTCSRSTQCRWLGPGNLQLLTNSGMTWSKGNDIQCLISALKLPDTRFGSQVSPAQSLTHRYHQGCSVSRQPWSRRLKQQRPQSARQYEDVVPDYWACVYFWSKSIKMVYSLNHTA